MKKLIAALLLVSSAPVWAACYPLDATQADLDAAPIAQGWTAANVYNGQSMYVNITPAEHTPYAALSHAGLEAMQQAAATGQPMGDFVLPDTGVVHVRMHIDDFPWDTFSGPQSQVAMFVSVLTGNMVIGQPTPAEAMELNIGLLNTNTYNTRTNLWIVGQSVSGGSITSDIHRRDPITLPASGDVVGMWINVDTRQIGLSVRITATDPSLPPPGDYDLAPLVDEEGRPVLLPAGVNSVALGLGAFVHGVPSTDPLQGATLGATLLTDYCNAGPQPQALPNGKLFPGKAAPKKFQGLPFPFVGKPPFAGQP